MTSETSELFAKQLPVDELDDLRDLDRRAPRRGGYGGAHVEERLEPAEIPEVPLFFRQRRPATPSTVKSLANRTTGWAVTCDPART
jgi:hypothetical protein